MTRIVSGLDVIGKSQLSYAPDRIWWSERAVLANPADVDIYVSGIVPDGSIVHEVQIQASSTEEQWLLALRVVLSIVQSEEPSLGEVYEGDRVIDWRWAKTGKAWYAVNNPTNERWPMRRTLHGSHMRFAVSFETQELSGCAVRVGVLYSPG